MKRKILLLLLSTILLTACANSTIQPETQPTVTPTIQPTVAPAPITYNDDIVSFEYDSNLLSLIHTTPSEHILYGVAVTYSLDDAKESIINGNCVCITTMPFDSADILYTNRPHEATEALFNGIFQISEGGTISEKEDGSYEYTANNSGFICKGKILNATNEQLTSVYYRMAEDTSSDIISAFTSCYDSIVFLHLSEASDKTALFDEMMKEAEEKSANSKEITSGDLYDSIISVYPNVKLTNMGDGDLSILLEIEHSTIESDSVVLFYLANEIMENCNIENSFSSINFLMSVDKKIVAFVTLLSYESATSFSSDLVVVKDSYDSAIQNVYNNAFLSHDIQSVFNSDLDAIAEQYGIQPSSTPTPLPENTTRFDFDYCGAVKNDVTGKWRLAKINTDSIPSEYVLEYYNTYFDSNDEIHAIINYSSNSTVRVQVLLETLLSVTELKHIEGEENDAKLLFSGDVIDEYVINIETGKIVNLDD